MRPSKVLMLLLLCTALFLGVSPSGVSAAGEAYVYYGYAPPTVLNLTTMEDDIPVYNYTAIPSQLDIIGINDTTTVEVLDLSTGDVVSSTTLDRMEVHTVYLGTRVSSTTESDVEGTYFKVVADKKVAVLLSGGSPNIYRAVYYPSTDGGFAGNEFIFKAVNGTWEPVIYVWEWDITVIFGVESAHVKVFDGAGNTLHEFDVSANSYGRLKLVSGKVYRVVSTGRIMISTVSRECFAYGPSATGGFVGRSFYGVMSGVGGGDTWAGSFQSFVVIAQEDCEISAYSLLKPELQRGLGADLAKSLEAGEVFLDTSFDQQTPLRIDSTGDIMVIFGRGDYAWGLPEAEPVLSPGNLGDDVSAIPVEADREVSFFAPTGAVIFAPESLSIVIDGALISMKADEYRALMGGSHTIQSSAPVIVEVLSDANTRAGVGAGVGESWATVHYRFDNWATYLTPTQTLEVTYPPPPPAGSLTELYTYIGGGVSAAVIAVVALVILRRRRAKT
ncbi:MAG: hypothetical protein OEY31_06670 [Candidatus Bathyarchaeota archaeon]|nr:hypothetical protein [Candidatus Bathyarchaeota archaeon]